VLVCAVVVCATQLNASTVDVTAPTTSWTIIKYGGSNSNDPFVDQQTGSAEGDIVGNQLHPSVYTMFGDNNTTANHTDGTLAFSIRLGADMSPAGFKTAAFVGIDANGDGKIDLFVGVNNSGSKDTVGIWNPGTGANISPNTTSIVATPLVSYTPVAANYNWAPVSLTNDPSVGTATDLDGGGQNDYFLSFAVPFNDVVTQLANLGITGVNDTTTFSYVVATSTQGNSLNQDLNGVGKNYDPNATWSSLGVMADGTSPIAAVPEPNFGWGVAGFLFAIVASRRLAKR
jgi:hypothetical protein